MQMGDNARRPQLPKSRGDWPEIAREMAGMRAKDADWRRGRTSLHVYYATEEILQAAKDAYCMFMSENALAPAAFPSLRRMEEDVVGITLSLLRGGPEAAGSFTSGGTESIILAVAAARARFSERHPQVARPHLLLPASAHPAYYKAAKMLQLDTVAVPLEADFRASPSALEGLVNEETMMIVASAPSLPFGVIDPVADIAKIAREHDVWLHVDACLGGYLAPFVAKLGYPVSAFDFSISGVRSISADLHKYGYAAKGASTVLYADAEDLERQSFSFDAWPKGEYRTRTLYGTRSGGAVAASWAVMHLLGEEGYLELARRVMRTRERLEVGLAELRGFGLVGRPELGVIAFGAREANIFAIADQMETEGWYVSRVADPPAMQKTLTPAHEAVIDDYLHDLGRAARKVRDEGLFPRSMQVVTY